MGQGKGSTKSLRQEWAWVWKKSMELGDIGKSFGCDLVGHAKKPGFLSWEDWEAMEGF